MVEVHGWVRIDEDSGKFFIECVDENHPYIDDEEVRRMEYEGGCLPVEIERVYLRNGTLSFIDEDGDEWSEILLQLDRYGDIQVNNLSHSESVRFLKGIEKRMVTAVFE